MTALRDIIAGNPFLAAGSAIDPIATVIVPLYNAVDDAAACIESIALHTTCPFRLVLINDGSTDPRMSSLLSEVASTGWGVVVMDQPDNNGFVVTINEGLALTPTGDVVILNSDTVVSARWLDKLAAVALAKPNVATVTPMTNNGTICSVPVPMIANEIPADYDVDSFAALIEALSHRTFPEAPTGVGFCMLITRRALDIVGPFDAQTFGAGYAEENDFCQRAIKAGFVNLIADDTFVYHKGQASFGDRTPDLLARHLQALAVKHPGYAAAVEAFSRNHPLHQLHADLERQLALRMPAAQAAIRHRVLHILHRGGGTEKHARELAGTGEPSLANFVLVSDGHELHVDEYHGGRRIRSMLFPLPTEVGRHGPRFDAGYRDALATICWLLDVNRIHVHHLMANALDIADVAAARSAPFVVTLHDYYMVCPRYTLLDPEGDYCGVCLDPDAGGSVDACMHAVGEPASYLPEHQQRTGAFLRRASAIIAPNERVREIVGTRFPDVKNAMMVIEHGHRRAAAAETPAAPFDGQSRLQVAVVGGLEPHKGAQVLRELLRANRNKAIVFHLYGTTSDPEMREHPGRVRTIDGSTFVYHGPYDAAAIVPRLRADGIHVGLQLAIWPETFSYTLSELVDAGIPVIAGDLGAQGERVQRFNLGWIVRDIRDPAETLAILEGIIAQPDSLAAQTAAMRRDDALTPIETTWRTYQELYRTVTVPAAAGGDPIPPPDATLTRDYVRYLAKSLADRANTKPVVNESPGGLAEELRAARERLRSPRHRIAETLGNALQKIPVIWPLIARMTDAVLARERRKTGQVLPP